MHLCFILSFDIIDLNRSEKQVTEDKAPNDWHYYLHVQITPKTLTNNA